MAKNEPPRISSLSEFIEWVNKLGSGNYLFRGVPNAEYSIQASAYRRPKEENRNFEKFIHINKHLIADARLRGHGERNGRELGDLEILAQLQHFGAATCLIDFTRNAQVALYFACQKDLKCEKKSQDSENLPNGQVYAVRNNDPLKLKKVTPDLLKEKIDYFFTRSQPYGHDPQLYGHDPQLYYWEPGYQNNRIIAQQSTFVFGNNEFDENDACIVEGSCKEDILIELEQVSDINESMLFPDFDGFARLNREEIPYTDPSASDYFNRAMQKFQAAQYEEAIQNYDMVIELDHQDSETYEWRAAAKIYLGRDEEAIDDFNKMVEINPNWYTYEKRGQALFRLNRRQQAIIDFDKMIELAPDIPWGYIRRGKAKCELGQHQDAIPDFDTALQIAPDDVYTYKLRALIKERLRDFEGAKEDLQKALTLDQSCNARYAAQIKFALQRIEKHIAERT